MSICKWSCETPLCATSYLEQGFYQTDMIFKGGKMDAVADWLWTWDKPFDLLVLPLFPVM